MEMTREKLKQYVALKRELQILDKAIEKLRIKSLDIPTVLGKVTGSSHDFPYIEEHITVQMDDPIESNIITRRILIKEKRKEEVERQALEIENFISSIPDSTDRQIFELIFLDGKKQREVAEIVGLERSSISKRINNFL